MWSCHPSPSLYCRHSWHTVKEAQETQSSIREVFFPGAPSVDCAAVSISRATELAGKFPAHWPRLPAQGEHGNIFKGQKSTFSLDFSSTGLCYSFRFLALKCLLLLSLVFLIHFKLVLQICQICTPVFSLPLLVILSLSL